jgi:hypothetical protein
MMLRRGNGANRINTGVARIRARSASRALHHVDYLDAQTAPLELGPQPLKLSARTSRRTRLPRYKQAQLDRHTARLIRLLNLLHPTQLPMSGSNTSSHPRGRTARSPLTP